MRGTIKAKTEEIRTLTDAEGHRLWSVTDRPVPGNPAHAEIQREPRGQMPGRAERNRFIEVWRGATLLLATLKKEDPMGKPELQVAPNTGVVLHWRTAKDGSLTRVGQVESVAEAIRAYVGAGIVAVADAPEEQRRLEQELASRMRTRRTPSDPRHRVTDSRTDS